MERGARPPGTAAVWVSTDGTQRFYTRRARQWQLPLLAWFFAVVGLLGPAPEAGVYDSRLAGASFVVVVLLIATYVTVAAIRSGILVQPGRLTNRRMLWTDRVAASDIDHFDPPPSYYTLRRTGIRIAMRDGSVLSASAFTKGRLDSRRVGVAECAELNAWLQTQGTRRIADPLY